MSTQAWFAWLGCLGIGILNLVSIHFMSRRMDNFQQILEIIKLRRDDGNANWRDKGNSGY